MTRLLGDIGAAWRFLRTGLRQIDKTASLFPSSRFLVRQMVGSVDLTRARCVVEFGPGTGTVTEAILAALPAGAHLHSIELDGELLRTTVSRIRDERLRPIHGSAADALALVRAGGCTCGADAVFSSLGLALMTDALRAEILRNVEQLLRPQGTFVQYTYLAAKLLTYQFGQGWSRFDGGRFLERHFREVRPAVVLANAPPATVYTCRGPLGAALPLREPAPAGAPLPAARRERRAARRRVAGRK